jgi:hypothetical protein
VPTSFVLPQLTESDNLAVMAAPIRTVMDKLSLAREIAAQRQSHVYEHPQRLIVPPGGNPRLFVRRELTLSDTAANLPGESETDPKKKTEQLCLFLL